MSEHKNVRTELWRASFEGIDTAANALKEAEDYMESYPTIEWGSVPKEVGEMLAVLDGLSLQIEQAQEHLTEAQNSD